LLWGLLGKLISVAMKGFFLSGFSMGPRNASGIDIFHLLFADNTLIYYEADIDFHYLSCLFLYLEVVSGLKIDLAKLEVAHVGNV